MKIFPHPALPNHLTEPLNVLHPLEPEARRSDFLVPEEAQQEFRIMRGVLRDQIDREGSTMLAGKRLATLIRIDEIEAAIAPHKILPPEILSEIFLLAYDPEKVLELPPRDPSQTYPWCIARCCSRWRQIIFSTGENWKYVKIFHRYRSVHRSGHPDLLMASIQQVLSRGTQSIELHLQGWDKPSAKPDPIRDVILFRSAHLTHITVVCTSDIINNFLSSAPIHFPYLSSIKLAVTYSPPKLTNISKRPIFQVLASPPIVSTLLPSFAVFSNATRVQDFSLTTTRMDIRNLANRDPRVQPMVELCDLALPWSRLTQLKVRGLVPFTTTAAHSILSACELLEVCILRIVHAAGDDDRTRVGEVILSSLHTFELHVGPSVSLTSFFKPLKMPALTSFELHPTSTGILTPIRGDLASLLVDVGGNIKNLSSTFVIPSSVFDNICLGLMSSAHTLDVPFSRLSLLLMDKISHKARLPQLNNIQSCVHNVEEFNSFLEMVERRWILEDMSEAGSHLCNVVVHVPFDFRSRIQNIHSLCQTLREKYGKHNRRINLRFLAIQPV